MEGVRGGGVVGVRLSYWVAKLLVTVSLMKGVSWAMILATRSESCPLPASATTDCTTGSTAWTTCCTTGA